MNRIINWVITLLIILSSAEFAPAKGRIVDGIVNPSTTLTIKSLIEAQCGEIKVVCPRAVHSNIKCLTPCAMGYRAVIGRNRVLVTHMWPARTIGEFHQRTGLKSLDNPNDALPSLEVIPQVIKDLEKAEAKAEAEKARADALKLEVEALRVEKKKTEDLVEKLKAEKIALEGQVSALKEEGTKMAEQLKLANEKVTTLEAKLTPTPASVAQSAADVVPEKSHWYQQWYWWVIIFSVSVVLGVALLWSGAIERIKDRGWWRRRDSENDDEEEDDEDHDDPVPFLRSDRPPGFPQRPEPLPPVSTVAPVRPSPAPPARRPISVTPAPVSSNPDDADATMVSPPVNPSGGGAGDGGGIKDDKPLSPPPPSS